MRTLCVVLMIGTLATSVAGCRRGASVRSGDRAVESTVLRWPSGGGHALPAALAYVPEDAAVVAIVDAAASASADASLGGRALPEATPGIWLVAVPAQGTPAVVAPDSAATTGTAEPSRAPPPASRPTPPPGTALPLEQRGSTPIARVPGAVLAGAETAIRWCLETLTGARGALGRGPKVHIVRELLERLPAGAALRIVALSEESARRLLAATNPAIAAALPAVTALGIAAGADARGLYLAMVGRAATGQAKALHRAVRAVPALGLAETRVEGDLVGVALRTRWTRGDGS